MPIFTKYTLSRHEVKTSNNFQHTKLQYILYPILFSLFWKNVWIILQSLVNRICMTYYVVEIKLWKHPRNADIHNYDKNTLNPTYMGDLINRAIHFMDFPNYRHPRYGSYINLSPNLLILGITALHDSVWASEMTC